MKYYTGTVNSHSDLKSVIEGICTADLGWTLNNGVLTKNGVYAKLEAATRNSYNEITLQCGTGQSGSALTGAPARKASWHDSVGRTTSWPATYHIHGFTDAADGADEVYIVIKYNVEFYAALAFGKSTIPDAGGTGAWQTGSGSDRAALNGAQVHLANVRTESRSFLQSSLHTSGTTNGGYGAPFWSQATSSGYKGNSGAWVHCAPDGTAAWEECNLSLYRTLEPLMHAAPPTLNSANLLFPVKAVVERSDNRLAIVQQNKYARFMRMDMVQAEEVIEYGGDKWMCYPWYRLNKDEREPPLTSNNLHTGTYGFALAYPNT